MVVDVDVTADGGARLAALRRKIHLSRPVIVSSTWNLHWFKRQHSNWHGMGVNGAVPEDVQAELR